MKTLYFVLDTAAVVIGIAIAALALGIAVHTISYWVTA